MATVAALDLIGRRPCMYVAHPSVKKHFRQRLVQRTFLTYSWILDFFFIVCLTIEFQANFLVNFDDLADFLTTG